MAMVCMTNLCLHHHKNLNLPVHRTVLLLSWVLASLFYIHFLTFSVLNVSCEMTCWFCLDSGMYPVNSDSISAGLRHDLEILAFAFVTIFSGVTGAIRSCKRKMNLMTHLLHVQRVKLACHFLKILFEKFLK